MTLDLRGMVQSFSAPCTLGYQGIKILPSHLDLTTHRLSELKHLPLQYNAFSPSLFELSYPFKIGLFLGPTYSLTASMTTSLLPYCVSRRWNFKFWEHVSGEYGGDEGFHIHIQSQQSAVMATCIVLAGALSCNSRTPWVSFPGLFFAIA